MMSYTGYSALTPWQLGRAHWTLSQPEEMARYRLCDFELSDTVRVDRMGYPDILYHGRHLSFEASPGQSPVLPSGQEGLAVSSGEVVLGRGFKVELGASFEVRMIQECP